jgi:hypothetical protein
MRKYGLDMWSPITLGAQQRSTVWKGHHQLAQMDNKEVLWSSPGTAAPSLSRNKMPTRNFFGPVCVLPYWPNFRNHRACSTHNETACNSEEEQYQALLSKQSEARTTKTGPESPCGWWCPCQLGSSRQRRSICCGMETGRAVKTQRNES